MINQTGNALAVSAPLMSPVEVGGAVQIAPDISAQFSEPLNAGPFASASTPEIVTVSCYLDCDSAVHSQPPPLSPSSVVTPLHPPIEPVQQWTAKTTGEGRAELKIGDGYTLDFDERASEIVVFNANTRESTRIWGDPHVDVDGIRAFDFWGTSTFKLENGTKITINTEQWEGNPNAYVASKVIITKGRNAVVVDGISQNQLGDLEIEISKKGYILDIRHRDGYLLQENASGAGWRSEYTGEIATQEDLDATRIGRRLGPGSNLPSWAQTLPLFSQFLMFEGLANFSHDPFEDRQELPEPKPRIPY